MMQGKNVIGGENLKITRVNAIVSREKALPEPSNDKKTTYIREFIEVKAMRSISNSHTHTHIGTYIDKERSK